MYERFIIDGEAIDVKTGPSMDDIIIKGMETAMTTDTTITEMLSNIDKTDLPYQVDATIQLINSELCSRASALRHRADMMRRRAEEFDDMADSLIKSVEASVLRLTKLVSFDAEVQELLQRHAHIEPQRVS